MAESVGGPDTVNKNDPCDHSDAVAMKDNYHLVLAFYVTCIAEKAYERKANDVYCHAHCKAKNNRIHACLECAFFGCFNVCEGAEEIGGIRVSPMKGHSVKYGHKFAINIQHGSLFCSECDDYFYNETLDRIFTEYKLESRKINGVRSYLPWMPNKEEIELIKGKIKEISEGERPGVRGIVNIGSSCYFNSIIQAFLHNPILKNYFLSDKHKCFFTKEDPCLMCAMFVMFQEFHSGEKLPYVPWSFFQVLQKFCQDPLGENEQDAHELFTEVLTGLRICDEKHITDTCNYIIDQIFFGIIQKERTCSECKQLIYFPDEHFLSILLDKEKDNETLEEILNRKFLTRQPLSGYKCAKCGNNEKTSYRETIKKLPAVICFRLNCFLFLEKRKGKNRPIKKNTRIEFKEFIDMSAYLNPECSIKLSNGSLASKNSDAVVNRYSLFAVLYHKGDATSGHFSVYIKQNCQWYECNDIKIYNRSWSEVLKSEPYLLYYCKQF